MFSSSQHHFYTQTWNALRGARRVALLLQRRPDGDNIASCLALWHALRARGTQVTMLATEALPELWNFLPHIHDAVAMIPGQWKDRFDAVVMTDTGDMAYGGIGDIYRLFPGSPTLINIDHHATNEYFGDVNCVDIRASAACEVVADILMTAHEPITPDIATCLLTGIITDTGFFSNPATSDRALEVASMLLARGAAQRHITAAILAKNDTETLRLWGRILERMRMHMHLGLAVTMVRADEIRDAGLTKDAIDGLANFLNILGEARAICVLREDEGGFIKASLRTTHPAIDVSRIAQYFGGGGHKKSAGFSFPGQLSETERGWFLV